MQIQDKTHGKTVLRMRAQRLVRLRGVGEGAARLSLGDGVGEGAARLLHENGVGEGAARLSLGDGVGEGAARASLGNGGRDGAARLSLGDGGVCAPQTGSAEAVAKNRGAKRGETPHASQGAERERMRGKATPLFSSMLPFSVYGAADEVARRAVLCVFSVVPEAVRREIEGAAHALGRELDALEEIRLSLDTRSSIVVMGEERALSVSLTKEDFSLAVRGVCHGTPFSYRTELAEGYLPFMSGVRVGAIGEAHYDEQRRLAGVSDIHTLTFRIPHEAPSGSAIERLRSLLSSNTRRGCLILGAPGAGKTTLLRALAASLCTGTGARRVAVVDTRREFSPEDGASGWMDILRGYRRSEGAAIALRTLSPGYIVMDEIGAEEDADAVRGVLASGVPLLATAHARDLEDACTRRHLRILLEEGAFDCVLVLYRLREGIQLSLYRI